MERSTDRILTTHTGSLPRPPALLDMLTAKDDGAPVDAAAFETAVAEATRGIVRQQIDCGIDVVNDGEMSKIGYSTYVTDRLSGFNAEGDFPPVADVLDFPDYAQRFITAGGGRVLKTPACSGPIAWTDRTAVDRDTARFAAALTEQKPRDAFMTAASPGVIALFLDNKYYDSHQAYLDALVPIMKVEYDAIHRAGFVLQLDCPDLAVGRHSRFAKATTAEFVKIVEQHVDAIDRAVADIPADRIRLHLCWGNYEGPHHRDVALADILPPVLAARAEAISFEAANPRHEHEWTVFQDVALPPGKILIPGVIDSSTNYIEHPELVAQRITRFAELVGRENVIAGSDCGFATFAANMPVEPSIAWAKLGALAEGARLASARLWAR
jgi:5-methyltetrahydropteroyltriglutamate--homocysteine methyltransferase